MAGADSSDFLECMSSDDVDIFLDAEGIPEGIIGKVYMLTNWFSHMAFLAFMCFVLTV